MSHLLEALRLRQPIDVPAADAAHAALLGALATKALRLQPADVAQRPAFDRDYGSYTAHPMDPRTPEPENDDTDPVRASDMAMELAGRADRAFQSGDRAAAADLYRDAARMLVAAADVCEAL